MLYYSTDTAAEIFHIAIGRTDRVERTPQKAWGLIRKEHASILRARILEGCLENGRYAWGEDRGEEPAHTHMELPGDQAVTAEGVSHPR